MAEVLVLVDSLDGKVKKPTLELLTAARQLGEPSAVVIGAPGTAGALKDQLAEFGAAKVYVAESDDIAGYSIAPKAEALASVAGQASPAAILLSSNSENKEIAARLAIKLDSGLLYDAVGFDADGNVQQQIFGASVEVTAKVSKGTPIITVRPNSFAPEPSTGAAEEVSVTVEVSDAAKAAKIVDTVVEEQGSRPQLSDASLVVSGGRGIGKADNFEIIEKLADSLGAGRGRIPCCRRRRVGAPHDAGGPDRCHRVAAALPGRRDLRCDPAPRGHADVQDDRRDQQGRRGADLRTRRLRRRR